MSFLHSWLQTCNHVTKKCVLSGPVSFLHNQEAQKENRNMSAGKNMNIRSLVLTAVLGAIAAVLMSFEIYIPFMPAFIKIDLSEVPVIVAGLTMGFSSGMAAAVLKVLLKFLFAGTSTMFVGELVNILISFLYLLPLCAVIRNDRSMKKVLRGLVAATMFCSVTAVFANYMIAFPMYSRLFGMSSEDILTMFMQFNPLVKNTLSMLVFSMIPFNLIKYGIDSLLAYFVFRNAGRRFMV